MPPTSVAPPEIFKPLAVVRLAPLPMVKDPVDAFTMPALPLPLHNALPEAVSVPLWMNPTLPASAMALEKVDAVARSRFRVAPLDVDTALEPEIEPDVPLPICSVPPVTEVAPV